MRDQRTFFGEQSNVKVNDKFTLLPPSIDVALSDFLQRLYLGSQMGKLTYFFCPTKLWHETQSVTVMSY